MSVWSHLVHFWFFDFWQHCILKMADHTVKQTKLWAWGVSIYCIHEYFWLLSIESHSEVIWCISDFFHFRQPCVLQAAGCRTIQTKIWASGASTCSRSVWGHLVHFQCFQFSITLYLKKRLVTEWNWPKFGPRGLTYCVVPMNIRIWLKWSWGTTSLPERHSPSDK